MVQTTMRFPKELHLALKENAKRKGLTLNAYLISICVVLDLNPMYFAGERDSVDKDEEVV